MRQLIKQLKHCDIGEFIDHWELAIDWSLMLVTSKINYDASNK